MAWRAVIASILLAGQAGSAPHPLALRRVDLDLPGPPAAIVATDLDHDGRVDLLVVVAYTKWGSIAQDRVEDAIAVTEVVPALFQKREALAFLAGPGGVFRAISALPLPPAVVAVGAGPAAHPAVALADDGVSEIALDTKADPPALVLRPLVSEPSAFAGARSFLPDFVFVHDVDGDGIPDAVIPTDDGLAIHAGTEDGGFAAAATFRGILPGDEVAGNGGLAWRRFPRPTFEDVDGDGIPDLVARRLRGKSPSVTIAKGKGKGRFGPPLRVGLGCLLAPPRPEPARGGAPPGGPQTLPMSVAYFGDLDGDGRAEIVTREGIDTGKSDSKQVKTPLMRYGVHRLRPDLSVDPVPFRTIRAEGYAFGGTIADGDDLEFVDLDGDGRKDLVTITLDFSFFQVLRVLTAKKLGIGLSFHVFAQQADGSFVAVAGQKLEEKLNLDLNRLEISRLGQFQGDFDGDGRVDFVHLGKGKSVTIHRGGPGCRYADKPDLSVALADEPEDVLLVRVRDFDGDGRSDIAITRTHPASDAEATAPVTLEMYLSGAPR
jgi:FG-GAP-like repeat